MLAAAVAVVVQVVEHDPLASSRARADRAEREQQGSRSARSARNVDRGDDSPSSRGRSGSGGAYQHHDWSSESEASRRIALGLPQATFWSAPPQGDFWRDPQLAAMWSSFHERRASAADTPELPFEPLAHRAELIDAEGDVSANPTSCDVRVLPVDNGQYNCVVRVMCDGAMLYPHAGQDAGYVPCDVENGRPIRALDDGYSDQDGDPLIDLDLASGTITVQDYGPDGQRRYRATLRIHS